MTPNRLQLVALQFRAPAGLVKQDSFEAWQRHCLAWPLLEETLLTPDNKPPISNGS